MAAARQAPPKQPEFALTHECDIPLLTDTRRALFATVDFFRTVVERAASDAKKGNFLLVVEKCADIDPGGILLLRHAGNMLGLIGRDLWIMGSGRVFKSVGDNLTHYLLPPEFRHLVAQDGEVYLLRGIEDPRTMVQELEDWASTVQRGTSATDEQMGLWQMQIAEVTTNSFQHGKVAGRSNQILIAGRADADSGRVQLAALDLGQGIPAVIRPVAPVRLRDGELIAYAFRKGVTSQCVPENQGAGLYSLARTVQENAGGTMNVLSNNGFMRITQSSRVVVNLAPGENAPYLAGTLTIINLGFERKRKRSP